MDFVFVYEVKKREIESIVLIGYELINRGYSIAYVNTWTALHSVSTKYKAKAAVLFEAYNTDVINFALSFIASCDNIFNMQWEQILNKNCLTPNSIYILKDDAKKAHHASWGIKNQKHLVDFMGI